MKYLLSGILMCGFTMLSAQSNFNQVFAAGVEDAEQFTKDYAAPLSESIVYNMATGWYNTANAKPLGGFEISFVANATGFKNKQDKQRFILNPNDYENLDFVENPGTARPVSTALGDLEGVRVFVEVEVGEGLPPERQEFELPAGLSATGLTFVPSGYLQGSVGLLKGTEVKARFLPKIEEEGASLSIIGFGLQHDFTKLLPADKILPVAISAVVGYTKISGDYDLTDVSTINGSNQRIESDINSWTFNAVVSTKLPIINFYGGLGYVSGKSVTNVLGDYTVGAGPFARTVTDPFAITQQTSGVTGNVGAKLKLGFFRLNADYTLGEFNTLTFGVNLGFR